MRTTVTFHDPVKWIWVDIAGVPKGKQEKVKKAFTALRGKGDSGLLNDKQTLYVVVEASKNTEEDVRAHIQHALDELRLVEATISITDAWAQAVELYPFTPQASRPALEERLKAFHVEEVIWLPDVREAILWTQAKLELRQIAGIARVFS